MGDLFALHGCPIPQTFQPTFLEFLKRSTDNIVEVRMSVLEHVKLCLLSDPIREEAPTLVGKSYFMLSHLYFHLCSCPIKSSNIVLGELVSCLVRAPVG